MAKKNSTVVAAYIAGCFAIAGPIVTYFITKVSDVYIFNEIPDNRKASIVGHWSGMVEQEFRGQHVTYPGELQLAADKRNLSGTLHIDMKLDGRDYPGDFQLSGGFVHDRFLRLDYSSTIKGAVHFGAMILELMPTGRELKGNFVAFGAYSRQIVNGPIDFKKSD